jgi:hypothetical protein
MVRSADERIVALRHQAPAQAHEANAAFIVKAVNLHDELVTALKNAEAVMSIVEPRSDKAKYLAELDGIRATLAKAEPTS